MLASKSENIRNLLLGLFSGISAADRPSLMVNEQHLRLCFRPSHAKETFQHNNHELHRSLVVIQQHYVATLEVRHYWVHLASAPSTRHEPDVPISGIRLSDWSLHGATSVI